MDKKDTFTYSSNLGSFTWRYEKFDSEILERPVAKIITLVSVYSATKRLIKKLIDSFEEKGIEYATYRIPAVRFLTIHALEDSGFRLVDGIMRLEQVITKPQERPDRAIRKASKRDIQSLQRLASDTFLGTRFYNDPLIKKHQADKIYSEWIKNSVGGLVADMVLLWDEGGGPVGFVTLGKSDGSIVLLGVSKSYHGRGIGKALARAALNQFLIWRLKSSSVETPTTNFPALRLYQSCGYKTVDSHLTFRWSNI